MKFDRSSKFDLWVMILWPSLFAKVKIKLGQGNTFGVHTYFAYDGAKENMKEKKAKMIGDSRDKFQPIRKSPTVTY